MKNSRFNAEQLAAIESIQERDNLTRKSAIRKYQKQLKATPVAPKAEKKIRTPKAPKAPVVKAAQTDAGKARSSGIQDFILAGRPSKKQFIHVYGPKGPAWTWQQREKAGIPAKHFQKALQMPPQAMVLVEEKVMAAKAQG